MTYVIWSFQRCTTSQVQHNDWEKWFQTLVVTALITYSALSPFLLSLALPSSLPLFSSLIGFTLWPDICHVAIPLMASPLPLSVWSNGNRIFLFSLSFHFFFVYSPHLSCSCSPSPLTPHFFRHIEKASLCTLCLWLHAAVCENSIKVTRVATNCAMVTCVLLIEHFIGVHMLLSVSAWSECI